MKVKTAVVTGGTSDLVRRRGAHRPKEQDHMALRQTRSVCSGVSHRRNPAQVRKPAGRIPGEPLALYEGGSSDALFSGEVRFFLDFFIAGLSP
jgi:hypothetical protein